MSQEEKEDNTANSGVVDIDSDEDDVPSYLSGASKRLENVHASDVYEDSNEVGNGGDSDEDFAEETVFFETDENDSGNRNEENKAADDSFRNMLVLEKDSMLLFTRGKRKDAIVGGDIGGLKYFKPPNDWVDPAPKTERGEPPFSSVDNPGKWSSFNFTPKYKKQGSNPTPKYIGHSLPTGIVPVPVDPQTRKRTINGWEFFYSGWERSDGRIDRNGITLTNVDSSSDEELDEATVPSVDVDVAIAAVAAVATNVSDTLAAFATNVPDTPTTNTASVATSRTTNVSLTNTSPASTNHLPPPDNLFPASRKGCLDKETLLKLGLTKKRMMEEDYLFFYQLLLPFCNTSRSGIRNDPRMSFYSEVERWTNAYAADQGFGGSYGHQFKTVKIPELVVFDGVIVRDGVRGGSGGALHRRWMCGSDLDDDIFAAMTYRRYLQIKRMKKLCNNNTAPKRGQPGYDPAYKFDYIYKCIVHNVNALTKQAGLDLCGDETTWATASPGEAGSGITGRVVGKPGVNKGGQTVIVSDVDRFRPRAYMHRHKLHMKPDGWTIMSQWEVSFFFRSNCYVSLTHLCISFLVGKEHNTIVVANDCRECHRWP